MKKLVPLLIIICFLATEFLFASVSDNSVLAKLWTPENIFWAIVIFITFDFVLELALDILNYRNMRPELPEELKDIYDEEKYAKSQLYEKARFKIGLIKSIFSYVLIMTVLVINGFAIADNISRSLVEHPVFTALVFFSILYIVSDILSLPFQIYSVFSIEERFGFNKMTPALFVADKIKGYLLSALIGGGLLSLIIFIYLYTGSMFWVYAWGLVTTFTVFITMFYSTLIVPLFNKQRPLPEGELRTAIEEYSKNAGFKLDNIYEIDGSKRSTKANAYFSGFGFKKRIVLFDTLIKEMTTGEIVAVLAHEIGHYKKKHVLISMVMGILQTGAILFIFSILAKSPQLSAALGVQQHSFHIALITFGILFTPINLVLGMALNVFSRKNEYEADAFAGKSYDANELASALKKLSVKNLSNLTPHPAYVFFHYSHPPVLKRLNALKAIKK
ncbi:MAG TPA: M48 family metallopeptidase [Spirochaetota bacterium]|nr:M48 family metallopeptidase [Spirochaetota bacterium]